MKVLIIGKNGNVGSFLEKNLKINGEVYSFDRKSLDITSKERIKKILKIYKPEIIINCAAFLNADRCEEYKYESYEINYKGVVNIAKAINEIDKSIKLIHFSTDFIFDGNTDRPYKEEDLPVPKSVYGLHKYMAEEAIKNLLNDYMILRIASIINFEKKNNFIRRIIDYYETKNEVQIVYDLKISLTPLSLISRFLQYIIKNNKFISGVYNLCANGITTWYDIAKFILERKYGRTINIKKISHTKFNLKAYRPLFSAMDNSLIKKVFNFNIDSWEKELEDYYEQFKNYIIIRK